MTWNPLTETTYWTVNLQKAVVGETKILTSTYSAIIDSGTSYLAMPDYDLKSLTSLLGSVHGFDCAYQQ